MTRIAMVALVTLLAGACWNENSVIAECERVGRCRPEPDASTDGGNDGSVDGAAGDSGSEAPNAPSNVFGAPGSLSGTPR